MTDNLSNSSRLLPEKSPALFDKVSCPAGAYNEPFSAPASPRPHWHSLLGALEQRGRVALESDHERGKRMRHEDGATINPFDDLTEQTTAWALDMIPFPISAQEWKGIERGMKQRARLLDKILADTYGPQELLKEGADINFRNIIGRSALSYAITFNHKDIENFLIQNGAIQ